MAVVTRPVIARSRVAVMRSINKAIRPHLWESGYRTGPIGASKPLRLWCEMKDGKPTDREFALRDAYTVGVFTGFTEGGLITDSCAGAIVVTGWSDLPYEDLLKVWDWLRSKFKPEG